MQVNFRNMVESPMNAPLEQSKKGFSSIRRGIPLYIFSDTMVNYLMSASEIFADSPIRRPFIGHNT